MKRKWSFDKYLFIAEVFVLLILFAGCFQKEKLVARFSGADIRKTVVSENASMTFCSEKITMKPGVYQVRVWAELSDKESVRLQMRSEDAYYQALKNNEAVISSQQNFEDFEVYVQDTVKDAYMQCDFNGADVEGLVCLEVWDTHRGSRMLVFMAAILFAVLNFLIYFRKGILNGTVSKRQQTVFWVMVAGVLLAYAPYLTDYCYVNEGSVFYWRRIAYLADELKNGKWYGNQLFFYIPVCLQMLGFSFMSAYKMFVFLILTVQAAGTYFCFKKCTKDEYAALFGSILYLLMPCQLDRIYNRGAVAQYLAIIFWLLVSLIAAFVYRRLMKTGSIQGKAVIGIVVIVVIFSAVYRVNNIMYESEPVWLYNIESMRMDE